MRAPEAAAARAAEQVDERVQWTGRSFALRVVERGEVRRQRNVPYRLPACDGLVRACDEDARVGVAPEHPEAAFRSREYLRDTVRASVDDRRRRAVLVEVDLLLVRVGERDERAGCADPRGEAGTALGEAARQRHHRS